MITENDIPKASKESEIQDTNTNPAAELLGVKDGYFQVLRSDGSFDTGWHIAGVHVGPMGERTHSAVIVKDVINEEGARIDTLLKEVRVDDLRTWQEQAALATDDEVSKPLSSAEQYTKRRLERLFAPPLILGEQSDESPVSGTIELDEAYLFEDDEETKQPHKRPDSGVRNNKKALPLKEENIKSAEYTIRVAVKDPVVASLVEEHKGPLYRAEDMVKLIRNDADLRLKLGTYFVDILDSGDAGVMPLRISRDDWKTPSHGGYEDLEGKVRSREYVAKLVLAMMDGTFDNSQSNADPIEVTYTGDGLGQHRTAAKQLLRFLSR